MSTFSKIFLSGGALSIGCFGYWVQQKSHQVPEDRRGYLLPRIKEVASALFKATQIKDEYTAKKHIEIVATLSSKYSTEKRCVMFSEKEILQMEESCHNQALEKALHDESVPPIVYTKLCIRWMGEAFSGPLNNLHDLDARNKILDGNYILCNFKLPIQGIKKGKSIDVLLTGTTNCKDRERLHERLQSLSKPKARQVSRSA